MTITPRQRMVLQFWDNLSIESQGKEAVSAWIDQWHNVPAHRAAWTWWKLENEDTRAKEPPPPCEVELGAGKKYLERLRGADYVRGTWPELLSRGSSDVELVYQQSVLLNDIITEATSSLVKTGKVLESDFRTAFFSVNPRGAAENSGDYARRFLSGLIASAKAR